MFLYDDYKDYITNDIRVCYEVLNSRIEANEYISQEFIGNEKHKDYTNIGSRAYNDGPNSRTEAKNHINEKHSAKNFYPRPKRIYYDETAGVTVVMWKDGTKTIVRAAENDKHDAYLGYCAALAKKIHGTNSALKRDIEKVLIVVDKKEKEKE